ncbi:FKBP-type peptidyl-prolyl cis-trans isomerase N-terminal domain-containing protein, partial [Burkholderia sp. SIMBA_024]|uniref:FKBP-type peptidyl-prolyl cis-trans isomerase N-terminal domain-containing protein n=1 Tax=Burkholderia sp. SIMBA_024 TaxID=3085768 RepID=UPI00397DE7F4
VDSPRVRRALRLLPLPLSIAICLPAMADEKPLNWDLCPAIEPLPGFEDAPPADKAAAENKTKSTQFLATNKAAAGVQTLPSGVQYKVLEKGTGAKPTAT